jgi:phosphopantothenoylcysteine decarboxylase/phosphopantothenate--cysteine ligase
MARVLVGVSGGIAAYKAVELVRLLGRAGHSVRVIQTASSERFVGRATFEGITGAPVLVDEFERDPARGAFPGDPSPDHAAISHLELVHRADAFAIVPASANTLAKLANGLADNLLSSAALALGGAPLVVAPAMNDRMWAHPATRENVRTLRARGAWVVGPGTGDLASRGEWGAGRLADPQEVLAAIEAALGGGDDYPPWSLDGVRVLVTAGGTREPIDAVRFVGNRSSGRMGVALAEEAARRGAQVTVVAANVSLERPGGVRYVDVETAAELEEAVRAEFPDSDVLLMAAAVADFRPTEATEEKISKAGRAGLTVELEPTADVLATLAEERRPDQTVVGFAAETGQGGIDRARGKLDRKRLDAVVLNDVARGDIGFESAENEVAIVTDEGVEEVSLRSKAEVATRVLDAVERLRAAGGGDGRPAADEDAAATEPGRPAPEGAR